MARVDASDAAARRRRAVEHGSLLREYAGRTTLLLPPTSPTELGMPAQRLDGFGLRSLAMQWAGLDHVYCELMAD